MAELTGKEPTAEVSVVPFGDTAVDITASLRRLADRIDRGDYGAVRFLAAALVSSEDAIGVFAYGMASNLEISGALMRAVSLVGTTVPDLEREAG